MLDNLRALLLVPAFLALLGAGVAHAYPVLQIYMDGATYDPETESWVITKPVFDLWLIGDVSKFGTIYEVKLAVAFFGDGGTFTLTPKTTGLVTDPSVPDADPSTTTVDPPYVWSTGYPCTGDKCNDPLPNHGVYNDMSMDHWTNYYLGDFSLTDSPVGDFMTDFPADFDSSGQINVYEVSVTGWDRVHFDAFDHTVMTVEGSGKEKVNHWKAPFSHDATHVVPEPATLALFGSGLLGLACLRKAIRKA